MSVLPDTRPPFLPLDGRTPEELFGQLETPCYILDEAQLHRNGHILRGVAERTDCRILLAQKAFSCFNLYGLLAPYLSGTEASGLFEARLGAEEMPGKEVHVFCAAYTEAEIQALPAYIDHIVFNSPGQLKKYGPGMKAVGKSVGLRINPQCSTQNINALYDPCAPLSRLGTTRGMWDAEMTPELISLLDGLHFHTLCEQDADALEATLAAVEDRFGDVLPGRKWLNMGGGHHITRPGYDLDRLEQCIQYAKERWGVQVYLEPGEAVALNAGFLLTRVLDVLHKDGVRIAILDTSAACHMPDVLEMPYRPPLYGSMDRGEYMYLLGGPTCLAGDVIGEYAFSAELKENTLLLFGDMAIYSICKNNTFNGMPLPEIYLEKLDGTTESIKRFGYEDFKRRV